MGGKSNLMSYVRGETRALDTDLHRDYKDNYFAIGYSTDSSQQIRHNREKNLKNEKDEYTSQVETDRDSAPLNSIPTTGLVSVLSSALY